MSEEPRTKKTVHFVDVSDENDDVKPLVSRRGNTNNKIQHVCLLNILKTIFSNLLSTLQRNYASINNTEEISNEEEACRLKQDEDNFLLDRFEVKEIKKKPDQS
jgi:hypothetical protein